VDPDGAQNQRSAAHGPPGHLLLPATPYHPSHVGPPVVGPRMDKRPSMERRGIDLSKERVRKQRSKWLDKAIKTNPEFAKRYYPEQYELYHGGGGGRGGRGGRGQKRRTRPKRPGPIDRLLRRARRAGRRIKENLRRAGRKLSEGLRRGRRQQKARGSAARGNKPPEHGPFTVDQYGNVVPTPPGGRATSSPDGRFVQGRDAAGKPTGTRIDGPHKPASHPDPRAQQPHGHVPGVTNPDGTPWLPIKQKP